MIQDEVPIDEETFKILRYLSGMGWWAILAVILIVVVLYKKYKK